MRATLRAAHAFVLLLGLLPARPLDDREVEELLREALASGGRVDPELLDAIAAHKTEAALAAMKRITEALGGGERSPSAPAAYAAFRHFVGTGEIADEAIEFLVERLDVARGRGRGRDHVFRALVRFGEQAVDDLERLARKHPNMEVRAEAIAPILQRLAARGDADALEIVIDGYTIPASGSHEDLVAAFRKFPPAVALERFAEAMTEAVVDSDVKVAILEAIRDSQQPDAEAVLVAALKRERELRVLHVALEILRERGSVAQLRALEKLVDADDPAVRRSAWLTLARIRGHDGAFAQKLLALASDRDPVARQSAAVALAELGTDAAIAKVHALLADEEYAVRAEALAAVAGLRRADSVPRLVDRLAVERGKLRHDVAHVLRLLTGKDHGLSSERWRQWWDAVGATFVLPPLEEVRAIETAAPQQQDEGHTFVRFYGLNVVSDHVCFLLDVSGSMNEAIGTGVTRLDIAKRELRGTLEKLPEGEHVNVIFFSDSLLPWRDELTPINAKSRASALEFVESQTAAGGTALFDAIEMAFEDPEVDTIFVLTDGEPSAGRIREPDAIREEVRRQNSVRKITIHCVGIGDRNDFLQGLAEDSGGIYRESR